MLSAGVDGLNRRINEQDATEVGVVAKELKGRGEGRRGGGRAVRAQIGGPYGIEMYACVGRRQAA